MSKEIAEEFAKDIGFDTVELLGTYGEYDVYKPVMDSKDEILYIGMPFYIIVKEEKAYGAYGKEYIRMNVYFNTSHKEGIKSA